MLCSICPRACGAERTARAGAGFCRMPDRLVVARAALHQWEEPCLVGERGAGTVFFSGCNLGCVYCQNAPISHGNFGQAVTGERLYEIFGELAGQGAACIDLVSPTHFTHILARVLDRGVPGNLPVVWNSGGYECAASLRALEGKVQIYLPDLKHLSPERAGRYCAAPGYPEAAKAAILEMYRQRGPARFEGGALKSGVLIRHLLLPGGLPEAKAIMDWVAGAFPEGGVLFSLMAQYTPVGGVSACPELRRPPRPSEVRAAGQYMADLGLSGYVQDLEAVGKGFIPGFDLTGVVSAEKSV